MKFNKKLQELRKGRGLTQEELARHLYVSRTAISKWESGRGYPNIDSLKAIAKFFSITVDELLSTDEVLTIAEENKKQTTRHFQDMVFGLIDVCAVLLLFLPLFAQRNDGSIIVDTSLLLLDGVNPYLKAIHFSLVAAIVTIGIVTLALQNCTSPTWIKIKLPLSLILSAASVILFAMSLQPYAATFSFALLSVKAIMLIKHR